MKGKTTSSRFYVRIVLFGLVKLGKCFRGAVKHEIMSQEKYWFLES